MVSAPSLQPISPRTIHRPAPEALNSHATCRVAPAARCSLLRSFRFVCSGRVRTPSFHRRPAVVAPDALSLTRPPIPGGRYVGHSIVPRCGQPCPQFRRRASSPAWRRHTLPKEPPGSRTPSPLLIAEASVLPARATSSSTAYLPPAVPPPSACFARRCFAAISPALARSSSLRFSHSGRFHSSR